MKKETVSSSLQEHDAIACLEETQSTFNSLIDNSVEHTRIQARLAWQIVASLKQNFRVLFNSHEGISNYPQYMWTDRGISSVQQVHCQYTNEDPRIATAIKPKCQREAYTRKRAIPNQSISLLTLVGFMANARISWFVQILHGN